MAKETCENCYTKLAAPVAFCPTCDRPTRHANDAERLDWDLRQWHAHVNRSVAAGVVSNGRATATEIAPARMNVAEALPAARPTSQPTIRAEARMVGRAPASEPFPAASPEASSENGSAPSRSRRIHLPRVRSERAEGDRVIDLDADHEFAYRACPTCEAADWVVRATRNEDDTWNYWCVRCSRSFKSEIKIRRALKPFLSGGIVVGGLMAASILLLH